MTQLFLVSLLIIVMCSTESLLHPTSIAPKELLNLSLTGSSKRFNDFSKFILQQQQLIIKELEIEDRNGIFIQDSWSKEQPMTSSLGSNNNLAGYGITAVIEKGQLLEKGAVSTTIVRGYLSEERATSISSRNKDKSNHIKVGAPYFAAALSLVLHSKSPMVPTFRADIRYFEVGGGEMVMGVTNPSVAWFGGGADLTPYYLFDEDVIEFHQSWKDICDTYCNHDNTNTQSIDWYEKFKKGCDDYFYIPARMEHRGVGGIFYDDLSTFDPLQITIDDQEGSSENIKNELQEKQLNNVMNFSKKVCQSFMPSYLPIVRRRRELLYSDIQRHWQLLRRGRYIEFNMLYDRGVKFGLTPGGRIEAVMVSCPPLVAWDYNHQTKPGSEEERLMGILKSPRDWIKYQ